MFGSVCLGGRRHMHMQGVKYSYLHTNMFIYSMHIMRRYMYSHMLQALNGCENAGIFCIFSMLDVWRCPFWLSRCQMYSTSGVSDMGCVFLVQFGPLETDDAIGFPLS